jgi:hydrogenase nickel incorporation protein HypA/HybF
MHELSITQGILRIALEASERSGARPIRSVQLVIGELSSIVDDSVQFYFSQISRGTLAEKAVLQFRRVPANVLCLECGHTLVSCAPLPSECPRCGSIKLRADGSRDFYIESIEVEDEAVGR